MNWTALRKTLTPSLQGSGLILLLLLGLTFLMTVTLAIIIGSHYVLTYLFGVVLTGRIEIGLSFLSVFLSGGYIMIVDPLIDRYRRIKRNLERENNG